ncbi:hypothetical protein AMATHDRAFT_69289 [Amanita thiersii Skay4041]|uniref:DH domain-containing protein n=1 Tax=Amanita thiersii Skay4041 TaxID=703135 RepID=A0A2A9NEJ0_9AGAR|nr:hypothetical protein AMATHDRAFT_69289 [Amanita thiersii Skay4041]
MPEPEPYYDPNAPTRPSHYSADSYASSTSSNDMLKRATVANATSRRLPQAPIVSPYGGQYSDRESIVSVPSQGYESPVRHHSPLSPPAVIRSTPSYTDVRGSGGGATTPTTPYDTDQRAPAYTNGGYVQGYSEKHSYSPPSTGGSMLGVPPSLTHQPSRESMLASSVERMSPKEHRAAYVYADSKLSRSVSGSSQTGFYQQYPVASGSGTSQALQYTPPLQQVQTSATRLDSYVFQEDQASVSRRPTDLLQSIRDFTPSHDMDVAEEEYWEEEDEEDETRFVNFAMLSHMAVQLRDKVPRGVHVKGSIPYPRAFTGKDIVSTIQSIIQRELAINHGMSTNDRRAALHVARSLQSQLFFYEVEWGNRVLQDNVEDVYMFLDDQEGPSSAEMEREELPTGVITMLTKCYAPMCGDGGTCYAYTCPRVGNSITGPLPSPSEGTMPKAGSWRETVDPEVLRSLPESEKNRQDIIHKIITKEEQYVQDLDTVETMFIKPLRKASPPIMEPEDLEHFIDEVFGNILDLRECNRRLLEVMYVRQREQAPIIQKIGDIFLEAATEFRLAYPSYIGQYPIAEKRLRDELESNPEFRLFIEGCERQSAQTRGGPGEAIRLDLKHLLSRPAEHLQKYPMSLEAVLKETERGNPDADFLQEATEAIKNLQSVSQLRTFQNAMGKGTPGKWEWHDLVSQEVRKGIIFELIKGEMAYVKDLENIDVMYIQPLRNADPPIIPYNRLEQFIQDVFHNYLELYAHHSKLVDQFHEIQREEHPRIRSITAPVFDTALNFREAYMEYIPNYPIAAYRIDEEMATNPAFKTFVEGCIRHPDAHRHDMKTFINRPIPRLLRYELLLKGIMEETPPGHEDLDAIPQVIDVIKTLGKDTEPGVTSAKQKVELWQYNSNLVFKHGEVFDLDLLDENRSLIYSGKLLRQPDGGLEWNGWSELFVLLFDNYLVMTKPKERDGVMKYYVNRRPIPLDLLTLVNFNDPPTQRGTGLLRGLRGERHVGGGGGGGAVGELAAANTPGASPDTANDSRAVYPMTLHHNGRMGGPYILYVDSQQARAEWKKKLEEALVLRRVVQDSNKVFEVETLSADTFLVPSFMSGTQAAQSWNQDVFTGKVTCSVPFTTNDNRALVAIGCAEGVWIGFRHDPKSLRRVLHLKMVTQCAMLEEFGIFLVLADKSLFAYHIEALVPTSPHTPPASQVPQKLNGSKDVYFFRVGTLHNRTLVIYMKKKGLDSIFRVLEPVGEKISQNARAPVGLGSRLGLRSARSEWFRIYRDFFLPSEAFDLIFLKAKVAILCAKGFEIMDLNNFDSVTIPQREDPRLAQLSKRCENARPKGMFRSAEDEFLLCYDEFGVYVNKHGDPSRSAGTIEWEGTAERVALHSPYILLFDSRFIEIRHIETGRLAQIIPGNDIRCIWDGRGIGSNVSMTPAASSSISGVDGRNGDALSVQEAQVHAVMTNTEQVVLPGNRKAIAQNVFELIPTVPLYLPGSLNAPHMGSFLAGSGFGAGGGVYQSHSPPRSPELSSLASSSVTWR